MSTTTQNVEQQAAPATYVAPAAPAAGAANGTPATTLQRSFHSASLYVGDLHRDVSESILFSQFSTAGTVISIRVCRDTVTRNSLGYAYVNFEKLEDAEMALDTMNFEPLMGHPMRIMWSQRDPSLRRSGQGNVFIKNMDRSIDTKSIYDTFSMFGNILSCKVAVDDNGVSKGYGFIHFESEESAVKAIARVNGMLLDGKKVYVGKFIQREARKMDSPENSKVFTNVFVKNFEDKINDDELGAMFSKYGEITSAVTMKFEDGRSKGFGFVCFKEPEDAAKAVEALNDSLVPNTTDKKLFVGRAQKKNERVNELRSKHDQQKRERQAKFEGVNLYVKNLDDNVTDEQLQEQFEGFGKITSAKIMKDDAERSKGFGFVCYESRSDATKAVTEMNGKMFGCKPLYVALAQRKEERKAQLANQYTRPVGGAPGFPRMQPGGMPAGPYGSVPGGFYLNAPMQNTRGPFPQGGAPTGNVRHSAPRWTPVQGGPYMGSSAQGGFAMNTNGQGQYQQMRGARPQGQNGQRQFQNGQNRGGNRMGNMGGPQGQMRSPMQGGKQNVNYYMQPRQGGPPMGHNQEMAPQAAPEQLTSQMLAKASVQEQKQMIGERIYPLVAKNCKEVDVGKITGMMLEMENSELLVMLENEELLQQKVNEAAAVLNGAATQGV